MPANRYRYAHNRLHRVIVLRLSAIALIGVAAALGTAGTALAAPAASSGYGPPPVTPPPPPGRFTSVTTTVTVGPGGDTIGPVLVDGTDLTVSVPAGAFPRVVQITITAPDLAVIVPQRGFAVVAGAGILVTLNGSPYPGTFLKPITATFRSSLITASSTVVVWNGSSFVTDPGSTTTPGAATVSFDSDPDFAVESPVSSAKTPVPGATLPVTGKPLLGEGILAGALVMAGAGGVTASRRRRRARGLSALLKTGGVPSRTPPPPTPQEDGTMQGSGARFSVLGISIAAVTVATLASCSSGGAGQSLGPAQQAKQAVAIKPLRILDAPKGLQSAAQPQPDGTVWALAGNARSKALFDIDLANGSGIGSVPVSNTAQSVTESLTGVVGLALGSGRTGALELLNGSTGKVTQTIPLGAPARAVALGGDGATFYVLDGTPRSASVTVVDSQNGAVQGTIPVPLDTVSIAPDPQGTSLYALQPTGQISQIALAGGQIVSSFPVGSAARSVAVSPDGSTLYVLKDAGPDANVAVVDLATQSVQRVLPAPVKCLQVLVSADGSELYQVVGTSAYGNIQVFPS
jgi:DNA-binding beta-propeller fold protein YncE